MKSNDTIKTSLFLAIALVMAGIVWATAPRDQRMSETGQLPENLFPRFEDPSQIANIRIARRNSMTGELDSLEIANADDQWLIVSKDRYPADVERSLNSLSTQLLGMKPVSLALSQGDSQQGDATQLMQGFGVLDPEETSAGETPDGAGTKVVLTDGDGSSLLGLIVGRPVPANPSLRYVRPIGQSSVYAVELNMTGISPRFEDWTALTLLDIAMGDVSRVVVNDYFLEKNEVAIGSARHIQAAKRMLGQTVLGYDGMRWSLQSAIDYRNGGARVLRSDAASKLNSDTLIALGHALDNLQAVNVVAKPKTIADTLATTGAIPGDAETEKLLLLAGYKMERDPSTNQPIALSADQGETLISMEDGVTYTLAFGAPTGSLSGDDENAGMQRCMIVTASIDPTLLAEPALEPLPELPPQDDPRFEEVQAEHRKIADRNQRAKDKFARETAKTVERVRELNARFAPWYYMVDERLFETLRPATGALLADTAPEADGPAQGGVLGPITSSESILDTLSQEEANE